MRNLPIDNNPSSQLKVGYVLKRFPRFSETFIINEILELERQGADVEVFSLMHPPEEQRHALLDTLRAPVTYLPPTGILRRIHASQGLDTENRNDSSLKQHLESNPKPFASLFPAKDSINAGHITMQATTLAILASARGIQHLHAHFASNATTVALLASRLSRIPFSFTAHARDIYHTYVNPEVDDALRRSKIEEARFVVTVSDYNREHLKGIARSGSQQRIRRLYNGIDLHRFIAKKDESESNLLIAVGRLVEKKGFPYLIKACGFLRQRGVDFKCMIIGEGPDRDALSTQIKNANLGGLVLLAGQQTQEQLVKTMRKASAVVLPCIVGASGDRDGLPTVLLEGMAMGLPAISTRVAGIPEIIDHKQNGLLVEPENSNQLASAMECILVDSEQRINMGRQARQKAERCFDLAKNVAVLKDYFAGSANGGNFEIEENPSAYSLHHSR